MNNPKCAMWALAAACPGLIVPLTVADVQVTNLSGQARARGNTFDVAPWQPQSFDHIIALPGVGQPATTSGLCNTGRASATSSASVSVTQPDASTLVLQCSADGSLSGLAGGGLATGTGTTTLTFMLTEPGTWTMSGTLSQSSGGGGSVRVEQVVGADPLYFATLTGDPFQQPIPVSFAMTTPSLGPWTITLSASGGSSFLNDGSGANNAVTIAAGTPSACDTIDFNRDTLFPDTLDIHDFLVVFGGGVCGNDPNCGDVDFNNDGLFPDTLDIQSLLSRFAGGPCL